MITDQEDNVEARVVSLEITWRNSLTLVRAHYRSASAYAALSRKPGTLIIFQHREHMSKFSQASYKLIAPLVREKHR